MNLQDFLIFCSGVDRTVLKRCPTDVNKYAGIGGTVLFTAILAAFAGSYALYTVFDSIWIAGFFGIIWGLMIFNLDRYIVSSMKNRGAFWKDLIVALPRIALAVLIALVISKPLELKLFEKEIGAELIVMEQEVIQQQEEELRSRFTPLIEEKESQIALYETQLKEKSKKRDLLSTAAIKEADGTGGTMKRNKGPIYMLKEAEAQKAQKELNQLETEMAPLVSQLREDIASIERQMTAELAAIEREPYNGLAARVDALDRLTKKSDAIAIAHIFIVLLFLIIESSPVIVKLISFRSPYDYVLHKHEHGFEMFHWEKTQLLHNATSAKVEYDTEVTAHAVRARIKEERARIDHEVGKRIEELKGAWNLDKG